MNWNYRLVIDPASQTISLRQVTYAPNGTVTGIDEEPQRFDLPLDWCDEEQTALDLAESELAKYQQAFTLPILVGFLGDEEG